MAYRSRIADSLLEAKLRRKGFVLITGCKWCGKTTTAEQKAKSVIYMNQTGQIERNLQLAKISPEVLLRGEAPRLIDEWQMAPNLWDAVRFDVDHRQTVGAYILTGSSVPANKSQIGHTGTGRFSLLRMRPMSLYESGDSLGGISLQDLFEGKAEMGANSKLDLERIAFLIARGGWPGCLELDEEDALESVYDYRDSIIYNDLYATDKKAKDPDIVMRMLRSYARLSGSQAPLADLAKDVKIDEDTAKVYLDALKNVFAVEEMASWKPNLRSKTAIRTRPTRYFVDPSIAVASLDIGPEDLFDDLNTFGFLFETLAIRDLRIYAESLNGTLFHYRDKRGLECDAVIHLRHGKYALAEIKLGGDELIEEGAKSLKALANSIDTENMKAPSFLMVLTAVGDLAYRREDGVYVIPIGALKN